MTSDFDKIMDKIIESNRKAREEALAEQPAWTELGTESDDEDTYVVEEELGRSVYYFIREMQKFFSMPEDDGMYKSKDIVNWAKDLADQFPQSIKDFVDEHDE